MKKKEEFLIGCNYWASNAGCFMWKQFDKQVVEKDLALLKEYGVNCIRIFPTWDDFQPIAENPIPKSNFFNSMSYKVRVNEKILSDQKFPLSGLSEEKLEQFKTVLDIAKKNGMKVIVAFITGWMSGRLFTPPAIEGKNLINDPEALMWMRRYIKKFVREVKNEKAIVEWGLGNECNCLSPANTMFEAYQWTATVVDAIRTEDNSRPIDSGMHGLASGISDNDEGNTWFLEHQGELCDALCTHPYPSPTVGGDVEPYTRLRTTCLPTAQTLYYAGVSGKPAYIQESGTFSQTIGSDQMSADFMRIQILSSIANNFLGYQWWCAWNQNHLEFPPYTWAMIERELGMFEDDHSPKPSAHVMKAMSVLLDKLPDPFPKREGQAQRSLVTCL